LPSLLVLELHRIFEVAIADGIGASGRVVSTISNRAIYENNIYVNANSAKYQLNRIDTCKSDASYVYISISDFINGVSGTKVSWDGIPDGWFNVKYTDTKISKVAFGTSETPAYAYTNWDSVWNISASGITLCGQTVYTPAQ